MSETLREALARNGFESNDDYSFQVRCLLEAPTACVRALGIEGDGARRKTAFATALAHALEYEQVLYHDFSARQPPPAEIILPPSQDELGREESPIEPLDDVVSQACAFSEGATTALILDQMQLADFREHIRVHRLVKKRRWLVRDAPYHANARNLLLFLISEEPLYHALRQQSFRVWIGRASERRIDFHPADFGLGADAAPLFDALAELFRALDAAPTRREMARILDDLQLRVGDAEHLRHALYGRCEGIDYERLRAAELAVYLHTTIDCLRDYLGSEHIELGGD